MEREHFIDNFHKLLDVSLESVNSPALTFKNLFYTLLKNQCPLDGLTTLQSNLSEKHDSMRTFKQNFSIESK